MVSLLQSYLTRQKEQSRKQSRTPIQTMLHDPQDNRRQTVINKDQYANFIHRGLP